MAVESRHSTDRRIILREPCTIESVNANKGVPTDITFSNGTINFNGTTSKLHYYLPLSITNGITYRFKFSEPIDLPSSFGYVFTHKGSGVSKYTAAFRSNTHFNILAQSSLGNYLQMRFPYSGIVGGKELCVVINDTLTDIDCFIDGNIVSDKTDTSAGVVADFNVTDFGVGVSTTDTPKLTGTIELMEVYGCSLTPETVSLLYSNKLYTGFVNDGLVLFADYTRKSSRNLAREYGDNVVLNGAFNDWTGDVPDGWTSDAASPVTIIEEVDGACRLYSSDGTNVRLTQSISLTAGTTYRVLMDVLSTSGGWQVWTNTSSFNETSWAFIVGSNTFTFVADGAEVYIQVKRSVACDVTFDNISVQEVLESSDTNIKYLHGLGANFEQNTSEINYGSPNIFDVNTGDFTLETVITPFTTTPLLAHQAIVGKGFFSAGDTGFGLAVLGIGTANFYAELTDGVSTSSCVTAWDYTAGVTYHIVIVRDILDGVNGSFKMYINGILDNTTNDALKGDSLTDVTEDFVVGNRSNGDFDYYGVVKMVRMYKGKALSANDVRQNYQVAVDRGYLNG